jgi:hypothetical protein
VAELGQQASEIGEDPAQDFAALANTLFGKSKLKIAHAHPAQSRVEQADHVRKTNGTGQSQRPGQQPKRGCQQPDRRIFQTLAHSQGAATMIPRAPCRVKWSAMEERPDRIIRKKAMSMRPNGPTRAVQATQDGLIKMRASPSLAKADLILKH